MKCGRTQELLKSDYFDKELSQGDAACLKGHLAGCAECRSLEKKLQASRAILQEAKEQAVPQVIWERIEERLMREELALGSCSVAAVITRLKKAVFRPKPVFALASAFAILILVGVFAGNFSQRMVILSKENLQEVVLGYSLPASDALHDLGTEVEKYFL